MLSSAFDIFRKKTNDTTCQNQQISKLINGSLGSTIITKKPGGTKYTVNLVIKDKGDGISDGVLYTRVSDNLNVGDYFIWDDNTFIICGRERNVNLDANLKKFRVRLCNVTFINEGVSYDGVFIGGAAANISYRMDDDDTNPILTQYDDSLLIFAASTVDKFDSCLINNSQWKIMSWDNTTNNPIIYATLTSVPVSLIDSTPVTPVATYYQGLTYSFPTEEYYFSCSENVKIERYKEEIKITMPYTLTSLSFDTKANGVVVHNNISIGAS